MYRFKGHEFGKQLCLKKHSNRAKRFFLFFFLTLEYDVMRLISMLAAVVGHAAGGGAGHAQPREEQGPRAGATADDNGRSGDHKQNAW